jgi:pimeloyl-ACP methyl ester carboxylesterase
MSGRLVRAPERTSFFFGAHGDHAAFLQGGGGDRLGVGTWSRRGGTARHQVVSTCGESRYTQPLPASAGRVLVLRAGAGRHHLALLAPARPERDLGHIDSCGLHLLPSPAPGVMAVAWGQRDDGTAGLWLINQTSPHIQPVPVPGIPAGSLHGGAWLDGAGQTLGLDHRGANQHGADHHRAARSQVVAVNLATGAVDWLPQVAGGAPADRLLLSERGTGRFLAARTIDGSTRLGWGSWDRGRWQLTFPAALNSFAGTVTPLAIDPSGRMVALGVEDGLRSEVYVCTPGRPQRQRIDLAPGTVWPTASWTRGGLHLVTSAPDRPPAVTTVTPASRSAGPCQAAERGAAECRAAEHWAVRHWADPESAPPGGWVGAHREVLDGPAGPIEAVIYGGPRWRDAQRLVFALHGGPHAAWKLSFDPLLQDLAAIGIAVVAPNQRGSTGYGPAHRDAIRGAWGGPDLADILHLATSVSAGRAGRGLPPLGLLGVSYGAFLALLAAAAAPSLWSACAAVAPFASAGSLYADGSDGVRSFLRRHEALGVVDDALGPRDLERLAPRITARLHLVHGAGDETIPASQSRRIVAALDRAGRRRGAGFSYQETPGGHDPLRSADGPARQHVIDFLSAPGRSS